MPFIRYVPYKPPPAAAKIIETAKEILDDLYARGYNATLRMLHYKFVSQNIYKNTQENYKRLGKIISRAREAGMIDWNHLKDRIRTFEAVDTYRSASEFMKSHLGYFRLDLWDGQETRCEVWCEKDASIEAVAKATQYYRVPYMACRGYMSSSAMWAAGHERMLRGGHRRYVILHLGDHDPSGVAMTEDIRQRLYMFSSPHPRLPNRPEIEVRRICLNMDQIKKFKPAANFAKESDPRWPAYSAQYGSKSWELEALDPDVIVALIQTEIESLMDMEKFEGMLDSETEIRERLARIADRIENNGH